MSAESTEIPEGINANAVLLNLLLSGKISLKDITQANGKIVQQLPLKKAEGVIDLCGSDDEDDGGDYVVDLKTAAIKEEEDDEQTTVPCDGVGITSFKIEKKRKKFPGSLVTNLERITTVNDVEGGTCINPVTPVTEDGRREHKRRKCNIDNENSIRSSALITRMQLACLTGGKVNQHQYRNILKVDTPMGYCGGRAIATKNGKVHHICIKEELNCPHPSSYKEQFVMYRIAPGNGSMQQRDIDCYVDGYQHVVLRWKMVQVWSHTHPFQFLQPTHQKCTAVIYLGHWNIVHIEQLRSFKYLDIPRCAKLYFDFDHFDDNWEQIIEICKDKSPDQIKEMDFNSI
ncbi:hypothetical protein ACHAWC_005178 [Mediolabrus comicus]